MPRWKLYLLLTPLFILTEGIFSMLEMACVSFNKIRLQYWVAQNNRRAKWLSHLLKRPTLLFGATLIGINASLQLGSECSRRFYEALNLSPDWAPLSQIICVIIFSELSPLFAGRRYAEHVAMLGVPLLYATSILLRPFIWLLDLVCQGVNRLLGVKTKEGFYLSREELQYMLEQHEEEKRPVKEVNTKEVNTIVSNIFSLKNSVAHQLMQSLSEVPMIPSFCTVGEMRLLLNNRYTPFLPIYSKDPSQILGIVYPRDLLRIGEDQTVQQYARPAWFITEHSHILHILKQFRSNNQSIAIVLNEAGKAVGILTLDAIIDTIFDREDEWASLGDIAPRMHHIVVDKTFPGDMLIIDFNKRFNVHLPIFEGKEDSQEQTLEELVEKKLGHRPEKGESVHIDQFELTIEEAPLIGPKKILVRTVY